MATTSTAPPVSPPPAPVVALSADPPTPSELRRWREALARHGASELVRRLGVSRSSALAVIAGGPVRRATLIHFRHAWATAEARGDLAA